MIVLSKRLETLKAEVENAGGTMNITVDVGLSIPVDAEGLLISEPDESPTSKPRKTSPTSRKHGPSKKRQVTRGQRHPRAAKRIRLMDILFERDIDIKTFARLVGEPHFTFLSMLRGATDVSDACRERIVRVCRKQGLPIDGLFLRAASGLGSSED